MPGVDVKTNQLTELYEALGFKPEAGNGGVPYKSFGPVESELISLYDGVGLRDISDEGIIELRGADSIDFLHRITTNALKDLQKEGVAQTIFTTEKGRIIDLVTVINMGDSVLLVGSAENKYKVISWIEKYVIMDDVKVSDTNGRYALLELLGPQSNSFITLVCGSIVNDMQANSWKVVKSEGAVFFLVKLEDRNKKPKYWILADHANAAIIIKYMIDHKGPYDFNLVGEEAYRSYRISQGIPSAPEELNDTYNPHEAGILESVSFTKGCYIGQEVIARLDTYDKVQRYIRGVKFDESAGDENEYVLYDSEGNEAGRITSTAYSPKYKRRIGLAFIRKAFMQQGTVLTAKGSGGAEVKVSVEDLPMRKR